MYSLWLKFKLIVLYFASRGLSHRFPVFWRVICRREYLADKFYLEKKEIRLSVTEIEVKTFSSISHTVSPYDALGMRNFIIPY